MKKKDTDKKIEPRATIKQQNIIGLRGLCSSNKKIWDENFRKLNGYKKQVFYEIDAERNKKTLERDDKIKYLLELIQEYKDKAGKYSAIARIILNVPGEWEKIFPDLKEASIKEGDKLAFYCEIDQKEHLQTAIDLLAKRATDKISILLC